MSSVKSDKNILVLFAEWRICPRKETATISRLNELCNNGVTREASPRDALVAKVDKTLDDQKQEAVGNLGRSRHWILVRRFRGL